MNRLLLFLLLLSATLSVQAQNIAVASFKALPFDLTARVDFPLKDHNGDLCAIVKVVTNETGFIWDSDRLGIVKAEKKTGEYWLYIPYGAKRLTIMHDNLGILRDYNYPEPIVKACVYELVLVSGKVSTTVIPVNPIWLTIRSNPEGAEVYINEVLKGKTPHSVKLTPGRYTYRLEKLLYHNSAGNVQITGQEKDGKKDLSVDLRPAYGNIKISTLPEQGAEVYIDDVETGKTTPFTGEKIKSGNHKITIKKELFQPKSIELTVKDGETVENTITLNPNFANVTITTQPEADIYINGDIIANGSYRGRVPSGLTTFEAKKENHYPDAKNKEIVAGEELTISLTVQPKLGNIEILSKPGDANIFLNGEEKGTTPIILQKLLVGSYELKLVKRGYKTVVRTITITEDKTTGINETLATEKAGTINPTQKGGGQKEPVQPIFKPDFSADYYKYKKAKNFWLASALVSGAAGTFAYLQYGKYYDQYQTATSDATALNKKVKLFNMIYPIAFGVTGFCTLEFILKAGKQSKAKGQKVSFYPESLPQGAGIALVYKF